MLCQLSRQQKADSSLDLTRSDGRPEHKVIQAGTGTSIQMLPFVVMSQLGSLSSNPLKEVVDKTVHDAHGLRGDTSVRVDLLQHLINWIHSSSQD